jgi:hypothetical protein
MLMRDEVNCYDILIEIINNFFKKNEIDHNFVLFFYKTRIFFKMVEKIFSYLVKKITQRKNKYYIPHNSKHPPEFLFNNYIVEVYLKNEFDKSLIFDFLKKNQNSIFYKDFIEFFLKANREFFKKFVVDFHKNEFEKDLIILLNNQDSIGYKPLISVIFFI